MNVIEDEEEQQKKEPTPTIETLEQKRGISHIH
jgi:hypothetical protein